VREVCHESAWGAEGNECDGSCKGKRPAGKRVGKCFQNRYKPYGGVHKKGQYPKGRPRAMGKEGDRTGVQEPMVGEGVGATHPPFTGKKRAIRIFQNNPNISNSRRRFHAQYISWPCKKGAVVRTRGGRGVPPTHPLFFFSNGGHHPPMGLSGWGLGALCNWSVGIQG
jgi:hypothetical protein